VLKVIKTLKGLALVLMECKEVVLNTIQRATKIRKDGNHALLTVTTPYFNTLLMPIT